MSILFHKGYLFVHPCLGSPYRISLSTCTKPYQPYKRNSYLSIRPRSSTLYDLRYDSLNLKIDTCYPSPSHPCLRPLIKYKILGRLPFYFRVDFFLFFSFLLINHLVTLPGFFYYTLLREDSEVLIYLDPVVTSTSPPLLLP